MSKSLDQRWLSLKWFSLDGKILLITKFLRTLAFGYLSVALPFYLGKDVLQFSSTLVGFILTTARFGGAAFTIVGSLARAVSQRSPERWRICKVMTSAVGSDLPCQTAKVR